MTELNQDKSTIWRHPYVLSVMLLLLIVGGGMGYWLKASQIPSERSADVGFARDMSEHHRQAVEMSSLLYDRTDDETMRILAYDILITQQAQIGMMSGWLDAWGYRWSSIGPKMEWMGMSVEGLMPGMATRAELNQLQDAQGVEADALFIQLMIPHHRAGVVMAEAAAEQAKTEIVRNLAQGMAEAQQAEIEYMQQLLQEKGYEPVPDEPLMSMDDQ
ncbi:MAG: DUF305 domain-containing protein [Anaerolineales bacterium]|nr:DUF305 domain-containing protein [Anaerolineales bacterium]